jgi:ubiquinone/menaquinone biosynthesis C-methylase UbiE
MLTTDYSKIALNYDKNALRHDIPRDDNIARLLASRGSGLCVLDLACGTANYLVRQIGAYADRAIEWIGLDRSPEMLAQARAKGLSARLIEGDAAEMPLEDCSVDYVKIRFALHHFVDKEAVLGEVMRVLKPGGELSIYNLDHDYSKDRWTYRYFPSIACIDAERFPRAKAIFQMLEARGFSVQGRVEVIVRRFYLAEILKEAENRDMSQLNLIGEEEYRAGLAMIRDDAERVESIVGDIAFLDFLAVKAG